MSFVNPDPTFGDQADRVFGLYQLIADIRDKHSGNETDARRVNLNNIMMAANAATATLRLMQWAKTGGGPALIQVLGLSRPEHITFVAEDLLRAARLFLLIESQFQIETLFRNLQIALRQSGDKLGFYNVAKEMTLVSGISDPDANLRTLNVAALLRNSMHANGIHYGYKGSSTVETIEGLEFRFDHCQRVQCGSWHHIVTAIGASIRIVDQILTSARIKQLAIVPDNYAVQHAADTN